MGRTMLLTAVVLLLLMSMTALAAVSEEEEVFNPHAEAAQCFSQPCETLECQLECDQVCANCHKLTYSTSLNSPTKWNPEGLTTYDVFTAENNPVSNELQDVCKDCHRGHYGEMGNHPVEVYYDMQIDVTSPDPETAAALPGCDEQVDCFLSCITCHQLHPPSAQDAVSLLRVTREDSLLCRTCHEL